MKRSELDVETLKHHLRFNSDTGEFWWRFRRKGVQTRKPAGYKNSQGYCSIRIKGHCYLTHRLVWLYVHGQWPSKDLDHINCDPSDNRVENLREASDAENMWNQGAKSNNTSGYKGVSYHKRDGKWGAYIRVNRKLLWLGYFDCPIKAHAAYREASVKYHGEFARSR